MESTALEYMHKFIVTLIDYTVLNVWVAVPVITLITIKIRLVLTTGRVKNTKRLDGKTVLITGGNAGIGKQVSLMLAERGARIVMACRNQKTAEKAKEEIAKATGNSNIAIYKLDLSSLDSIRQCAKEIKEKESRVDILINNAGAGGLKNKKTEDGLELGTQVNHFGPFLFTNLLLELVKKSAPSRIIFTSSLAHYLHRFDEDNINSEKYFNYWHVYANSKLYNILTGLHLSEKLKGTGVTVNSLHPGVVKTDIFDTVYKRLAIFSMILYVIVQIFGKSVKDGAMTTVYLATDDAGGQITGKYFEDCQISRRIAKTARNKAVAEKLWQKSEELVGLKPEEKFY